ncbi:MAG TPA: BON domain-containing protein [Thauera sp.]|uniref:BON domain-containing protein n=1 Tax=unclassified Thauera TaxID=2609274 RepID=UPI0002CF678F|nr:MULTISPECIES: BON domain-containing protein [unclassified Thauera]HNR59638.1 BON domain-containing protein [Thauera sp.]ENO82629.1 transport-associated protein [Thauera sp. 27]ENO93432.1 transport-associated protein [Thauera sp. 28]HNS91450.1 BON domain-containing protein [Thauera sp.]HRJ22879.1 BON domain-containing protein [Thauera sp.]
MKTPPQALAPSAASATADGRRRTLVLGLAAASALPLLQGCFPVVATGVGAGAAMVSDRRTSGTYVEDESIEWKVSGRIRQRFGNTVNVNVTSYNRNVLLTGQAPNATVLGELEGIVAGVEHVRGVINEVVVGPNSTLTARANDALITSNVKARFVDAKRFSAHHVKVVTEANVVFLLGIVTRTEADAAAEVARTSQGVRKVVRVFEFISDDEARRLDNPTGARR